VPHLGLREFDRIAGDGLPQLEAIVEAVRAGDKRAAVNALKENTR